MSDWVKIGFEIFQFFFMLGVTVYAYLTNRDKANKESIKVVDAKVEALDKRLTSTETSLSHHPDNDDIGELHKRIDGVGQGVTNIEGQLTQMNKTLSLLHEDRLSQGK